MIKIPPPSGLCSLPAASSCSEPVPGGFWGQEEVAAPHPLAPHLSQGDGGHVAEVVVGPFEPQVRFLPDNEGDVSWDDVGTLKAKGKKRGNGDGKGLGRGR